jgi:hypothetical protein
MAPLRKCTAIVIIACMLAAGTVSCSQPIDTGSPVPPQSQPYVALLALLGVGVALTALHHHNVNRNNNGGGGAPPVSLTAPQLVEGLGIAAFDIALDLVNSPGGVGALGTGGSTGRYTFIEVGSSGNNNGSYFLPSGFQPRAVAIDGSGDDWFLDPLGALRKCAPPAAGVTTCVPSVSLSDGLPASGVRNMAADSTHVLITQDTLSGTVNWAAFNLDGTGRISGSYTYTGSAGTMSADAVVATTGSLSISTYTIAHKDGSTYTLSLPGPAVVNPFKLTPPPQPNGVATLDGVSSFYGLVGSPSSGSYLLGHFAGIGTGSPPGSLVGRLAIAFNGQTSPDRGFYSVPLSALRTDGSLLYALDPAGSLVIFNAF